MIYPQHFIDELQNRADIVRIVRDFVDLKKKGSNWMGCCPFHSEKTPSFSVSQNKGLYKCFGCGKGGNSFTFLMEIEGLSFPEAIEEVAQKSGIPLPEPIDDKTYQKRKEKKEVEKKLADKVIELNQIALEFWEEHLQDDNSDSKAAKEYLEKRELDEETIKTFRIGFAPDSWDSIFNLLREKGFEEKLIRESGLVSVNEEKDAVYDKFRGRIMFPILDLNGQPIAFGARILDKGEPKYLNSPETPAYVKGEHLYGFFQNKDEIRRQKYGILVEGYMDLIALCQFGVRNCAASLGTAFTAMQAKLLGRAARKVVVNYDGDNAGVKAAKRAIETLLSQDFEIKVLVLPDGNDPDDYIRSEGFDAYKNQHLNNALPYLQFVLETIVRERKLTLPKQKAAAVEDILPIIASVRNKIEKRVTLKQALHYFQINDRVLEDHVWKELETNRRYANTDYESDDDDKSDYEEIKKLVIKRNTKKITVAEQCLLELLIHDEGLRKEILPQIEETDYETLALATIFEALFYLNENDLEVTSANLIELSKEDEIAADIVPILLMSEPPRDEDEAIDLVLVEAENCLAALRSMAISRRILEISQELAFAEQVGDAELLGNLVNEQIELARMTRDLQDKLVDY
ncbi:MAG: DNA primase [Aridibacter sp.]